MPSNVSPSLADRFFALVDKLLGRPVRPVPVLVPVRVQSRDPFRVRVDRR